MLYLSLGLQGIEQIWQLREFRLRGERKRQGREGMAAGSLSLERWGGQWDEIGLFDCEQMERHFRSRIDSMKGLTGCRQCLRMPLTKVTTARNLKMPLSTWGQGTETVRVDEEVDEWFT